MQQTVQSQDNQTVFNPVLTESEVRLTPAASAKMAELFAETDDEIKGIRVYVSGGGCGGMTYGMTFTDTVTEYDCVLEADGVSVCVDSVALSFLKGVEIDYVERPTGASFVFNNVFASTGGSGTCGACGAAGGGCA
jgi:iron-sulfur cluster insertion protein